MFWAELVRFWLHLGHHGHLLGNPQMLLSCKVLLSLSIVLELNLLINPIVKVKMVEKLSAGREWLNTQSLKNLLNRNLVLDSKELNSFLSVTKNIDALRDSKSLGESTSDCCVSENRDVSVFDPETDEIIRNLDLKKIIHPSPSQSSSIDHLFSQELENSNSPLSDIFSALSTKKNSMIYDVNQKFDFTAGVLNPAILKELGLNQRNLELISEGPKVNFKRELDVSKLKPKPNNRNVARNRSIVRNYLSCLEESGSISKVDLQPLVVSPLNLVPKSNGAPRLIHDLSRFNKFVSRGPKAKHLNVFNLSKNFLVTPILPS